MVEAVPLEDLYEFVRYMKDKYQPQVFVRDTNGYSRRYSV